MDSDQPTKTFWISFIGVAFLVAIGYWYWRTQFARRYLPAPEHIPLSPPSGAGGPIEVEVLHKDDLTAIHGIGPVRAQQLHDAGIYAFDELARFTPDALRDLLGLEGWQGDTEDWIKQARQLASDS